MSKTWDTSCKDCIFSIYEDDKQIGCKENRLGKFEKNGGLLDLVLDEESGLTHYIIRNRFCNMCVNQESLGDTPKIKWRDTILILITVRVAMVMYVGREATNEDVDKTLTSFLHQTELPYCLYIIIDNETIDRNVINDRLRLSKSLLYWKVERVLETGWGFDKSVDFVLYKTPAMYFTSCNAGFEYPTDYIERMDNAINKDMKQIVVVLPDENNNGLFSQTKLYSDIVKSEGFPFIDNLIFLSEKYNQEQFILKEAP